MVEDARAFFGRVRIAARDVEDCERIVSELADNLPPVESQGGGGTSGQSDPVFGAMVTRGEMLEQCRRKRDEAMLIIGEALMIISALRRWFCSKADVVEHYYIDRMSMREIADEMRIGVATASRWNTEMLDFIDANPHCYILALRDVEK